MTIASVRHTIDTADKFYEEEDRYCNRRYPEVMPYMQAFNVALLESPFRKEIDEEYGEFFLKSVKLSIDSFSEKNIALMQEESDLVDRYQKIMAACRIPFAGEECNLYGIKNISPLPIGKCAKGRGRNIRNFSPRTKRRWRRFSTGS